jgi:DNA mismatch repair protein MutS
VLVDEIGRGTSTYDGLSLAWACAVDLAERIQAFSLFATHYFEITELAENLTNVKNVHLDAVEHDQDIVFMYSLKDGPANQSYGIQVARLAGLPDSVLSAARQKLGTLESQQSNIRNDSNHPQQQLNLENCSPTSRDTEHRLENRVIQRLEQTPADDLSPRQALDLIYELNKILKSE